MEIRVDILQYVQNQLSLISPRTPNRIEIITGNVQEYFSNVKNSMNFATLSNVDTVANFKATHEVISLLSKTIPRICVAPDQLSSGKIVLLPKQMLCCGKNINIDTRPAQLSLYDIDGQHDALSYHARCKSCKSKIYYSYNELNEKRTFDVDQKYFTYTSGIAMSSKLLEKFSLMITIGSTSFQKIAEIYCEEHKCNLSAQIIEENWLIYRIVEAVKMPSMVYECII